MKTIMILKESLHETREKTLIVTYSFSLRKAFSYKLCFISFYIPFGVTFCVVDPFYSLLVDAESDQRVNIYSFVVRCDRRWPSTQWHRVYTGLGNVPYIQFESVGDFNSEPRCLKFIVGLQTREREGKMGCTRGPVGRAESGRSSAMS